jgi:hypothetical protein
VNAELATELEVPELEVPELEVLELRVPARRSARVRVIRTLGPLTVSGGVVWALLQPYRVTLLHPRGESFWWLAVQPPLLVIAVGLLFHFVVVPGLIADLESQDDAAR